MLFKVGKEWIMSACRTTSIRRCRSQFSLRAKKQVWILFTRLCSSVIGKQLVGGIGSYDVIETVTNLDNNKEMKPNAKEILSLFNVQVSWN